MRLSSEKDRATLTKVRVALDFAYLIIYCLIIISHFAANCKI